MRVGGVRVLAGGSLGTLGHRSLLCRPGWWPESTASATGRLANDADLRPRGPRPGPRPGGVGRPRGRAGRAGCRRTGADGGQPCHHRRSGRGRRARLRGHDRLRGPGHGAHRPGRCPSPPGEPARQPRRRRRSAPRPRDRAGHAPAARQHPGPRPERLPRRISWSGCSTSSGWASIPACPSRDRWARRATWRRWRTWPCRSSAAAGQRWVASVLPAAAALARVGLEPLRLEAKEGLALLNGTQLMSAIGALLVHDAERLAATASVVAAMSDRGAAGHGRGLRGRLPRRPPASRPGARRRRAARTCSGTRRSSGRITATPTGSRTPTRCAACPRSTAPAATPSPTPVGCSRSRSTRRPTTRSSSRPAPMPTRAPWPRAAAGSSAAATSTASRWPWRWTSRRSPSPSWAPSASGASRCSSTAASRACRPSSREHPGLNSGMMLLQYAAASLVSENKVLVHPASADSIPTSANQEDHVSMGATAARHARRRAAQRRARAGPRAAVRRPGPGLPHRAGSPSPARAWPRRIGVSASGWRTSRTTVSRGRTSRPRSSSSGRARSSTWWRPSRGPDRRALRCAGWRCGGLRAGPSVIAHPGKASS